MKQDEPMTETSTDERLTIQRLFQQLFPSHEFSEIPTRRLQRLHDASIFPNRALQSVNGPTKILTGLAFQSQNGDDYAINTDLLGFLQKEAADKKYLVLVSSEDKRNATLDYFDALLDLEVVLEKLRGVSPVPGKWGKATSPRVPRRATI
jgi:hypothetical protein